MRPSCRRRRSSAPPGRSPRSRPAMAAPLAEAPIGTNRHLYADDNPLGLMPFEAKVKLLAEIDAYARAKDPRVRQVMACLAGEWQAVQIVRGDGRRARRHPPAGAPQRLDRGRRRRPPGNRQLRRRRALHLYDEWSIRRAGGAPVDEALRQALVNLGSVPAPAGEMTVVLGPGWPGILLHEAIGHGLEGDFNRKKTSAFSGLLGQRIASDGRHRGRRRHHPRPPRLADHRRRGHADRAHRADRRRHAGGLHAGPPERAPDGHEADRQRAARKLRAPPDAAHDQHLHAVRPAHAGRDHQQRSSAACTPSISAAARSTSPRASSCSRRPRPT